MSASDPGASLKLARRSLPGLDLASLQHPLDRQAIVQLKRIRGFEFFMSKFVDAGVERMEYALSTTNGVRVGPSQLPKLYGHLREACGVLGVPEPELYVSGGGLSAITVGPNHPYIVLMSGFVDLMEDDELLAAVAHEVGHIRAGHLLYKSMASAVDFFGDVANDLSIGFSRFVTTPVQAGLLTWDRWSELTADRAALLVVRDPMVCLRMFMKLAAGTRGGAEQLDVGAFHEQVRGYTLDMEQTLSDRVYRFGATLYRGRVPFTVQRAKALLDWVDTGAFARMLGAGGAARRCPACGAAARPEHAFCAECGRRLAEAES